jgi:hypothetical protein
MVTGIERAGADEKKWNSQEADDQREALNPG